MILGEINVDILEENDPMSRADLEKLIPRLKEFQTEQKMSLVYLKGTGFRVGQRSTLIDLLIPNDPDKVTDTWYVKNRRMEHMCVSCTKTAVTCKPPISYFYYVDYSKINRMELDSELVNDEELNTLFSTADSSEVANTVGKNVDANAPRKKNPKKNQQDECSKH